MVDQQPPDLPAVPGFELVSMLGRGGCGAVYLAVQQSLERQVALKLLLPDHHTSAPDRRRFRQEAKLLGRLAHPHLMRVLAHGEAAGCPYIALEYLEGGTLRQKLELARDAGTRGLSTAEVGRLAREMLDALVTLHEASVVHRDIKPANVLFRAAGEAVLSDLGIAKLDRKDVTAVTATGQLVGTLAYLPPEAFEGKPPGPRGDLFSLGVLLFEALAGFHPTRFRPFQIAGGIPDPRQLVPGAPRALTELIAALLAMDPERRPESAAAALARLAPIGGGPPTRARSVEMGELDDEPTLPSASSPPSLPPANDRGSGPVRAMGPWLRRPAVLGALAATTLALLAIAALVTRPPPPAPPEVRVLGIEGRGETLAGWIAASPPAELASAVSTAPVRLTSEPVRVPLGADAVVSVRWPAGTAVRLALALDAGHRAPSGQRLAEVGIAAALTPRIPRMGPAASDAALTDWAAGRGIGWFAVVPDMQGRTRLEPKLHEELARRGVRSMVALRVTSTPGESGLERDLGQLAALRTGRPLVTFQDVEWDDLEEDVAWESVPPLIARWRSFLAGRYPALELLAPPVYALSVVEPPTAEANPAGRPDIILFSQFKEDADYWDTRMPLLRKAFGDRFSPSSVRWIFAGHWMNAIEAFSNRKIDPDQSHRAAAARSFVLARRHFPAATVVVDQRSVAHWKTGEPSAAWVRLEATALRLAGTTYERGGPVAGRGYALTFRDQERIVHALLTDRGGTSARVPVYRPARTGVALRYGEAPRLVAPHMVISLDREGVPVLLEELAPVTVTATPAGAVRVGR